MERLHRANRPEDPLEVVEDCLDLGLLIERQRFDLAHEISGQAVGMLREEAFDLCEVPRIEPNAVSRDIEALIPRLQDHGKGFGNAELALSGSSPVEKIKRDAVEQVAGLTRLEQIVGPA